MHLSLTSWKFLYSSTHVTYAKFQLQSRRVGVEERHEKKDEERGKARYIISCLVAFETYIFTHTVLFTNRDGYSFLIKTGCLTKMDETMVLLYRVVNDQHFI